MNSAKGGTNSTASATLLADVYNGRYCIEFNPRAHRYKVGDRKDGVIVYRPALPDGVTTICNATVPKYLDDWAGRVCVDYVRQHLSVGPMEAPEFAAMLKEAETAHQRIRDSAGDRGSNAHDYIEKVLTQQPLPEEPMDPLVGAAIEAFYKWRKLGWEVLDAERIVFSEEHYYCGKCDALAIVEGRLSVVDFKTGSGFYEDHPYQLCGYATAITEETGDEIRDGYIIHLDKRTSSYNIYHVPLNEGMKDAWKAAVWHYKFLKKTRAMVKEIKNGVAKTRY